MMKILSQLAREPERSEEWTTSALALETLQEEKGHELYSTCTIFHSLNTPVKPNLLGVPSKGKENLQAWLGKAKSCLLWGIINVNNIWDYFCFGCK